MWMSLVVCTRNRNNDLRRLLESLCVQSYRDFEVVVVDQSEPIFRTKNRDLISRVGESIRVSHIETDTIGLSTARNIGLQAIAGEVVGFPDDDCWYAPEVLWRVKKLFDEHAGIQFLSGMYTEPGRVNPGFAKSLRFLADVRAIHYCSSVTIFFLRSFILREKLAFDERLGAGTALPSGEESDFVLRSILAGGTGLYTPQLVIFHQIDRGLFRKNVLMERERSYGHVLGKNSRNIPVAIKAAAGVAKLVIGLITGGSHTWQLSARLRGIWTGVRSSSGVPR